MAERYVGAREANQQFSALLVAAERDRETIVITRRGKAIARLVPEPEPTIDESGQSWITDLTQRYSRPMSGPAYSRAELHDRGEPTSR